MKLPLRNDPEVMAQRVFLRAMFAQCSIPDNWTADERERAHDHTNIVLTRYASILRAERDKARVQLNDPMWQRLESIAGKVLAAAEDGDTFEDLRAQVAQLTRERDEARQAERNIALVKEYLENNRIDPERHKTMLEHHTELAAQVRRLEAENDRLKFDKRKAEACVAAAEAECRRLCRGVNTLSAHSGGIALACDTVLDALKKARGE